VCQHGSGSLLHFSHFLNFNFVLDEILCPVPSVICYATKQHQSMNFSANMAPAKTQSEITLTISLQWQDNKSVVTVNGYGKLTPTGYAGYVTVAISASPTSAPGFIAYTTDGRLPTCSTVPAPKTTSFVLTSTAEVLVC
jgi:hypothetical protein